jgi:hypothetical protein
VHSVTRHLTTNIAVIKMFIDREIECEGDEGSAGCVRIAGKQEATSRELFAGRPCR